MRRLIEAWLLASVLLGSAGAQSSQPIAMRAGVSVEMAVAGHAVEMRAADEADATVVAITAEGKVYVGVTVTEPAALSQLTAETVYVKADSRAPYQKVLAVLDALHGRSVVLLTAPPANAARQGMVSPYGVKLVMFR